MTVIRGNHSIACSRQTAFDSIITREQLMPDSGISGAIEISDNPNHE
jgi:hypothetical protein